MTVQTELSQLAKSMDELTVSIDSIIASLKQANQDLETLRALANKAAATNSADYGITATDVVIACLRIQLL